MIDLSGTDPWSSVGGNMANTMSTSNSGSSLSTLAGAVGSVFGGPFGGLAGSVIGGLFGGGDGGSDARRAAEAAYQRQVWINTDAQNFEREMSNTAMQRRGRDLANAGMNPMLAFMGQGNVGAASSPNAPLSSVNMQRSDTSVEKANSAIMAAQLGRENALTAAQLAKTMSETKLVDAQTAETEARTPTYAANIGLTQQQTYKVGYEVANILADTNIKGKQLDVMNQEITNMVKSGGLIDADTALRYKQMGLNDAEIAKINAEIPNIRAELGFTQAKSGLATGLSDLLHLPDASKFIYSGAQAAGNTAGYLFNDVPNAVSNFFKPDSSRRNWRP